MAICFRPISRHHARLLGARKSSELRYAESADDNQKSSCAKQSVRVSYGDSGLTGTSGTYHWRTLCSGHKSGRERRRLTMRGALGINLLGRCARRVRHGQQTFKASVRGIKLGVSHGRRLAITRRHHVFPRLMYLPSTSPSVSSGQDKGTTGSACAALSAFFLLALLRIEIPGRSPGKRCSSVSAGF